MPLHPLGPEGSAGHQPGTPTIGSASAGNASASVSFTAPSYLGKPIGTTYTATSTPGSITGTGSSSPISVSGLTNGTSYTFKVKLGNSIVDSLESAASNSVIPVAPTPTPVAPTPVAPTPVAPTPVAPTPVAVTYTATVCCYNSSGNTYYPVSASSSTSQTEANSLAVNNCTSIGDTVVGGPVVGSSISCSAPTPTPVAPTPVAPTPVAPTPVAPTPVAPTPVNCGACGCYSFSDYGVTYVYDCCNNFCYSY